MMGHMTQKPRTIGRTGVSVFPIGLGGMPLSLEGWPPRKDAIRVIHAALDAGVDFIDTANVYCVDNNDLGHNEALIREALAEAGPKAARVRVATKGGLSRPSGAWTTDGRPTSLRKACEKSLQDLGVERIFLYQLHAPDDAIKLEDSVGELARLRKEGKIEHIGLSNVDAPELDRALKVVRIESVQNRCSVLAPDDFRDGMVQHCLAQEVTYIAYSPVGGGHGKTVLERHLALKDIARKHGASPFQVALAWLLAQAPNVLPIPGASRVASIQSSVEAAKLELTAEELGRISG